ncbi:chemokine-like receptor 1 [Electrophorus electricus]|uniref:chemokine-like receptor 1 n=1 Tax=Electrophorus electricus TaxID=8005 RepID=UPI0015CFA08F|nr:chemokine-like receptor 1 [Electrophorus electricus]
MNPIKEIQNYYDYDYPDTTDTPTVSSPSCRDTMCVILATANVIIFVLGVTGNGLVMWIAGFSMKKSVNTTWHLSLAMSHFLFCAFLPFYVIYMVKDNWVFGFFLCKLQSFIMFINMFSSIFLLLIISVDRCVVIMFPVWAQNQRSVKTASVIVMLAWIVSALLSTPSAIYRNIKEDHMTTIKTCYYRYTDVKNQDHIAIVVCQFIFGFVIPFLVIVTCYAVISRKLKTNQMAKSKKPFRIMTVLIVCFFICWFPFHTVAFMELDTKYHSLVPTGQNIAAALATANSFMNPFLYAFMGKDFKRNFYAILSKIESAIEEE